MDRMLHALRSMIELLEAEVGRSEDAAQMLLLCDLYVMQDLAEDGDNRAIAYFLKENPVACRIVSIPNIHLRDRLALHMRHFYQSMMCWLQSER